MGRNTPNAELGPALLGQSARFALRRRSKEKRGFSSESAASCFWARLLTAELRFGLCSWHPSSDRRCPSSSRAARCLEENTALQKCGQRTQPAFLRNQRPPSVVCAAAFASKKARSNLRPAKRILHRDHRRCPQHVLAINPGSRLPPDSCERAALQTNSFLVLGGRSKHVTPSLERDAGSREPQAPP